MPGGRDTGRAMSQENVKSPESQPSPHDGHGNRVVDAGRPAAAMRIQTKGCPVLLLADFTLGDLLLGILAVFFAILAIWLFIAIFADIFTRPDLSGWAMAGWVLLIFIFPVIGILIYLIFRPSEAEVAARGILRRH